jgi:hypothetical protein
MLFKVTSKKLYEDNPEILGIAEFDKVDDRLLKWIFFVYDYESPYRKIPFDQRKDLVADKYLFSETKGTKFDKLCKEALVGKYPPVQKAIAAFKEMQYDDDRETLESIKLGIRDLREMFRMPATTFKEAKEKADLGGKIRQLAEEKKMLEQLFELRDSSDDGDDVTRQSSELDSYMEELTIKDKTD